MRPLYYRRDGTPYTGTQKEQTLAWADDFEDRAKKRVKRDVLPNGYQVSTVWLGLDHSFGSEKPQIFETMVFGKVLGRELDTDRYASEAEALEGHERMVQKWQEKENEK